MYLRVPKLQLLSKGKIRRKKLMIGQLTKSPEKLRKNLIRLKQYIPVRQQRNSNILMIWKLTSKLM